jgi:hypothetical protein
MKWAKYLFSGTLLLASLPAWRLLDWANVTLPSNYVSSFFIFFWGVIFIFVPAVMLLPREKLKWALLFPAFMTTLSWFTGPLSSMASLAPEASHCGPTSFTGFFYPFRSLLSDSYQDDLEARNQLCWITKMIKNAPETIPAEELADQLNLMKFKLHKPQRKYRVCLPWITVLIGKYLASTQNSASSLDTMAGGKIFLQSFNYWPPFYSEEISQRNYSWYDWPHSAFIKVEYGLIEKNWENIRIEMNP